MLTISTIFRTVIAILIPARLMHHMVTLGHDFIAVFKRSLTEITSLVDIDIPYTHVNAPDILDYILPFEQPIANVRYKELKNQVNIYKNEYCEPQTLNEYP
jgi:hypothetical protein